MYTSDAGEDDMLYKFINASDVANQVTFMRLVGIIFIVWIWLWVDF